MNKKQLKLASKYRIILIEDDEMFKLGLEKSLEKSRFSIVTATTNIEELPLLLDIYQPHCAIIDLSLRGLNSGFSFLSYLSKHYSQVNSLIFTSNHHFNTALNCFQLGAKGYLIKSSNSSQILLALNTINQNALYLDPLLTNDFRSFCQQSPLQLQLKTQKIKPNLTSISPLVHPHLSDKEKSVLRLLALGLNNQEISNRLNLSPNTVKSVITRLFTKLRVNNRTLAALTAYQLGLIA